MRWGLVLGSSPIAPADCPPLPDSIVSNRQRPSTGPSSHGTCAPRWGAPRGAKLGGGHKRGAARGVQEERQAASFAANRPCRVPD